MSYIQLAVNIAGPGMSKPGYYAGDVLNVPGDIPTVQANALIAAGQATTVNGPPASPWTAMLANLQTIAAPLVDNTGGAASPTFAAIAAGGAYSQTDMTAVKNALSQIAATLNSITAILLAAKIGPKGG